MKVRFLAAFLAIATCLTGRAGTSPIDEARELLDRYYGDRTYLTRAAALLDTTYKRDPNDAALYVEAARLTLKGGHVVAMTFRDGSVDAYGELLRKAVELDPRNQKAHLLLAGWNDLRKDFEGERRELEIARSIDADAIWLAVADGRYFKHVKQYSAARASFTLAVNRGPGATATQRGAYISALDGLASVLPDIDEVDPTLRGYAEAARRDRDPRDAWTLGSFAQYFIERALFVEAIEYSRGALATMDYGAGRLILCASLYGRAAQLIEQGAPAEARPLVIEARSLGYSRESILSLYEQRNSATQKLLPRIRNLIDEAPALPRRVAPPRASTTAGRHDTARLGVDSIANIA